jgi:hypothetical protein
VYAHEQQLTRKATDEIRKKSYFEEAKEPGREAKDRNMTVGMLTERFGLTAYGVKVSIIKPT